MAVQLIYQVDFSGEVDQATLEQVRADLGLRPKGRLTDAEDAMFGYREEQLEGTATTLRFALWRFDPSAWRLTIHYLGAPPPRDTIDRHRMQVRAAIDRAGLHVAGEPGPADRGVWAGREVS